MIACRVWTSLGLAALVAACAPGGDAPSEDNMSERMAAPVRRPSAPTRLSQQELAVRIGPRCPETTKVDYRDTPAGGGEYLVTCGPRRFRVAVAPDGATRIEPIRR
ncbi:hypothetical protein ACFSC3_03640 [Sphingomonas floccifaciens]|uniref:Lipoprotein n=1 Tax=Sphingomonas floccifaciens TaxID=1844115 RepID=A0ABW4NAQ9_9SPHN